MTTEVIMQREIFGEKVSQKSKSGFFSASDLVRAGNIWRLKNGKPVFNFTAWLNYAETKEFIKELEDRYGEVKVSSKGRNGNIWIHPYLFIDLALAISPTLKVEVYTWLFDHLLEYRNDSGDSYKKMAGALYTRISNKREFANLIENVAIQIKKATGVDDWQTADEKTLKKRDKMHEYISLLSDILPVNEAVRLGIIKALKETQESK